MAPNDAASTQRQSFSSISLAKEEVVIGTAAAAATPSNKRTGLNKKRFWIPAVGVYLLSVAGASWGFYRLGWDHSWDYATDIMSDWMPVRPINGYLLDVDGSRYVFNKDTGILDAVYYGSEKGNRWVTDEEVKREKARVHSLNQHATPTNIFGAGANGLPTWWPTMTKRKREWVEAKPTDRPVIVEETIEVGGLPLEVIEEVHDGVSEVIEIIEIVPSDSEASGSDSEADTVVVVDDASDFDSDTPTEVVEVVSGSDDEGEVSETELVVEDETANPEIVEVHDPTPGTVVVEDSEPEVVLEETEVTGFSDSASDSELHKRGNPPRGGYPPYAVGDEPYAYSGNGDRAITRGVPRFPRVFQGYTTNLEIPAGPESHRVNPTTNGGLRLLDPYKAVPTYLVKDAPIPDEGGYLPAPSYLSANPTATQEVTEAEYATAPGQRQGHRQAAHGSVAAKNPVPAPAPSAAAPAKEAENDSDHYVVTLTLPKGVQVTPAPVGPPALN